MTLLEVNYIIRQEGQSRNRKYFFYSRLVVFGFETCCFTKIAVNYERFPVSFQSM